MLRRERMKILIAHDGSAGAESMIEDLKRAGLPRQAEALVLSIAEERIPAPYSIGGVPTGFRQEELAEVRNALALARQAQETVRALFPDWETRAEAGIGSPGAEIMARADEWHPDLIIAGSQGRGALGRLIFGSVSQQLVSQARCGVRIARGRAVEPADTPVRLIAGIDGSPHAAAAVREIATRRWPHGGEITLVSAAWTIPPVTGSGQAAVVMDWIATENDRVKKMMDEAAETLRGTGLAVHTLVEEEEPKRLLLETAGRLRADCIFVGARGMGRLERILAGSVSVGVATRAHCSVEIIPVEIVHG
ncbi:MAG: universal stress protein [Blastocatellia bacterium]